MKKHNEQQKIWEPCFAFVKAYDVASSYDLKAAGDILANNFSGKILN